MYFVRTNYFYLIVDEERALDKDKYIFEGHTKCIYECSGPYLDHTSMAMTVWVYTNMVGVINKFIQLIPTLH